MNVAIKRDFYLWRGLGTAASFALFGVAGIFLGGVVFPVSRLVPMSRSRRRAFSSGVVRAGFRTFIEIMRLLGVLTYEFRGTSRLGRPGQLIVANHPSLIDVVFLLGFTPGAGCVVKAALWRNPVTGGVASSAGYVPNYPTETMLEGASTTLRSGQSVIMFPEGTRTTPGRPFEFHRGAASIAVRAAQLVTPVYITVEPTTLTKHSAWYRIPPRRPHFSLVVGDDLEVESFRQNTSIPLAGRALNAFLIRHFTAALSVPTDSGVDASQVSYNPDTRA